MSKNDVDSNIKKTAAEIPYKLKKIQKRFGNTDPKVSV
jgi:hypothetical protein